MEQKSGILFPREANRNSITLSGKDFQDEKLKAVSQVTGGIAHYFKNQLFGIGANAHIIKKHYAENEFIVKRTENIITAAQQCSNALMKLLSFAQRMELHSSPVDIHEIIRKAIARGTDRFKVVIPIATSLKAKHSIVSGDYEQLQIVLINLMENAMDAITQGGGTLTFSTDEELLRINNKNDGTAGNNPSGLSPGEYCSIRVRDTGAGMSKDILANAFEPFYTTKKKGAGYGLGLSQVYGIIMALHGGITINSDENKGTEVVIYLPVSDEKIETQTPSQPAYSSQAKLKGINTVLLIDDEEVVRHTTKELLGDEGITVVMFDNGKKAIEYYSRHSTDVDLVLLDMMLPELDGEEIYRRLCKINPNVKVIVFSANSDIDKASNLLRQGALGYIEKPGGFGDLYNQISKLLS